MKRTENDSWDLASSVGATATMVAAARAAATRQANPLIQDPFAEVLVRGSGIELFSRLASGELDYETVGAGWFPGFFAVRTHFFDDALSRAQSGPARQVVIVGSGLDSRAYRLQWPEDTVIYEIDQPVVIAFKSATLSGVGATPRAELRTVGVDLRQNWPMALREAGFDSARPTVWIAEGLMIGYLSAEAQDRLLGHMTEMSATGSRLIADHLPADSKSIGSLIHEVAQTWKEQGYNVDFGNLTFPHDRSDAHEYLRTHSWHVSGYTIVDLLAAADVSSHDLDTSPQRHGAINYLIATRR